MATATMPRSGELKLEYGVTEVFALKYTTGKNITGTYGPRVMFSTSDDRRIWLDPEDGSDLEMRIRELGVQPGDLIKVTKIRMPRGGGHALRVERVSDAAEADSPADRVLQAQLEKSIEMARATQAERNRKLSGAPATPPPPAPADPAKITPAGAKLCSVMMTLIDSMAEAKTYAQRRGIDLTNEDLRCLVTTAFINDCRGGR